MRVYTYLHTLLIYIHIYIHRNKQLNVSIVGTVGRFLGFSPAFGNVHHKHQINSTFGKYCTCITCVWMCVCVYIHTYIYIIHVCVYMNVCVYIYTYTYIYIYIYIYIYVCFSPEFGNIHHKHQINPTPGICCILYVYVCICHVHTYAVCICHVYTYAGFSPMFGNIYHKQQINMFRIFCECLYAFLLSVVYLHVYHIYHICVVMYTCMHTKRMSYCMCMSLMFLCIHAQSFDFAWQFPHMTPHTNINTCIHTYTHKQSSTLHDSVRTSRIYTYTHHTYTLTHIQSLVLATIWHRMHAWVCAYIHTFMHIHATSLLFCVAIPAQADYGRRFARWRDHWQIHQTCKLLGKKHAR